MPSASGETQDTETGGGKGITERNYSLPVLAVLSLVMSVWVSSSESRASPGLGRERYCLRVTTDVDTDADTETDEGRRQERKKEREPGINRKREREGEREKTWGNERETGNDREESSFKTDASIQVCSSRCIFSLFLVLRTWGDHRPSLFVRNVVNKSVSVTPGNDTLLWILSWEGFDAGELFPDEEK